MSSVLRCDRCYKVFTLEGLIDEDLIARFENPRILDVEDLANGDKGRPLYWHIPDECLVDLCPVCTKEFMRFMTGTALENEDFVNDLQNENMALVRENHNLVKKYHRLRRRCKRLANE